MSDSFETYLEDKLKTNTKLKEEWKKDDEKYEIIKQVLQVRSELGLTQKDLAKLMGTSQSYISRIESGDINIGFPFLKKFTKALGLELKTTIVIPQNKKVSLKKEKV